MNQGVADPEGFDPDPCLTLEIKKIRDPTVKKNRIRILLSRKTANVRRINNIIVTLVNEC